MCTAIPLCNNTATAKAVYRVAVFGITVPLPTPDLYPGATFSRALGFGDIFESNIDIWLLESERLKLKVAHSKYQLARGHQIVLDCGDEKCFVDGIIPQKISDIEFEAFWRNKLKSLLRLINIIVTTVTFIWVLLRTFHHCFLDHSIINIKCIPPTISGQSNKRSIIKKKHRQNILQNCP